MVDDDWLRLYLQKLDENLAMQTALAQGQVLTLKAMDMKLDQHIKDSLAAIDNMNDKHDTDVEYYQKLLWTSVGVLTTMVMVILIGLLTGGTWAF